MEERPGQHPLWHRRAAIGGMLAATAGSTVAWCRPWPGGRRYVTPESFGAQGNGVADDAIAFRAACRHCATTGDDLRLSHRHYRGARVEVHGSFDVLGEGATVDYLGIGNTLIEGTGQALAALPTAWPATDRDAYADRFPVRGGFLARAAGCGATVIELRRGAALVSGDWLFLAQQPTSMSSGGRPGNFIPSNFAYARIDKVNGGRVTLTEPLSDDFAAGAAAFASAGIAVDCLIADLTIATDADAYQHALRSGIGITLERITFAGQSAVGASTFADRVTYRDCRVLGSYGPLSVARGCGRIVIDGLSFATRRTPRTAEPFAIFLEESFRQVEIRRVDANGAGFSIRSTDLSQAGRRGHVLIEDCRFRTDTATQGATGPFQGGVALGLDIDVRNSVFRGKAVRPDGHYYPGVDERTLTWMASILERDRLSFTGCTFESIDGGVAFASGGGFQGRLSLDPHTNRFIGCVPRRNTGT